MTAVATGAPSRGRIAVASCIGTAIEFYDFYIYGIAAALVFGTLFFPSFSATAGTLAALATFAVGFIARPLGAVIFGHFGDRLGRKRMLIVSLLLMGLSTVLIGCVPSYASIGVAAPVLLAVLRFLQGIGLGGEWGGAVLLATEYAPPRSRGLSRCGGASRECSCWPRWGSCWRSCCSTSSRRSACPTPQGHCTSTRPRC